MPIKCRFSSSFCPLALLCLCDVISPYSFHFHLFTVVIFNSILHTVRHQHSSKISANVVVYVTEKNTSNLKIIRALGCRGSILRVSLTFLAINYLFPTSQADRGSRARCQILVEFCVLAST